MDLRVDGAAEQLLWAVFAAENQNAEESSLTGEEIAFLQRELRGYGYGEENRRCSL